MANVGPNDRPWFIDDLRGERTAELFFYLTIGLLLGSCLFTGWIVQQGTERHTRWLESFADADPEADAQGEIADQDYWLWRVDDDEKSSYPGIDSALALQLADEHGDKGIELLDNFADIEDQRKRKANDTARSYASRYNSTIAQHVQGEQE